MLKIYPSLVLENTPLYEDYKQGKYVPYSDTDLINVLTEMKKNVPKWVRIMRVMREIGPARKLLQVLNLEISGRLFTKILQNKESPVNALDVEKLA